MSSTTHKPTTEDITAWLIGVTLAVSANIISNLGLNFQKKAHSRREDKQKSFSQRNLQKYQRQDSISISDLEQHPIPPIPLHEEAGNENKKTIKTATDNNDEELKQGSYVCDPVWLLGLFLQILGALLDFAALGYAPQSVVAPLGSLTLVVNVCLSPCMHKEKPSYKTILATSIIVFGAITTVAASPREDNVDSIEQVFHLYENSSFLIYAALTGGFIAVGWCLTQYYVYLSREKKRRYKKKYYKQHRFVIAAISGTMGAQNVLFAKSVSTLVIKSIQNGGKVLFAYWETYLLLAGLVMTIYFQLRWLNSGLKRFSALYVAPTFQAFWITVSVMGGLVVYREFDDMNVTQKIIFPIGVIVTIFGVFYLTTQGQPEKIKDKKDKKSKKKHKHKNKQNKIIYQQKQKNVNMIHGNDVNRLQLQWESINNDDEININNKKVQQKDDAIIVGDDNISLEIPSKKIDIDNIEIGINEMDGGMGMGDMHNENENNLNLPSQQSPIPSPIQDDNNKFEIFTPPSSSTAISIPSTSTAIKTHHSHSHGLMGLIKNIGDIGEASIITGSSLGKLLLDPQGLYRDIHVGANEEDTHYKGILSPQMSLSHDIDDDDDDETVLTTVTEENEENEEHHDGHSASSSTDKIMMDENIKSKIDETVKFLPDNNNNDDDDDNNIPIDIRSSSKKIKIPSIPLRKNSSYDRSQRRHSINSSFDYTTSNNDDDDEVEHFSDDQSERYSRKRKHKFAKKRSRSHSPPLTTDELAPHEIVWEKFTSMFTATADNNNQNKVSSKKSKSKPIQNEKKNKLLDIDVTTYNPEKENNYASMEDDKLSNNDNNDNIQLNGDDEDEDNKL